LKLLISSPVNLRHNLCIKEIVAIDRSLCFHDLLQYSTLEKIKNIVMNNGGVEEEKALEEAMVEFSF
jgi:hypothetical protein